MQELISSNQFELTVKRLAYQILEDVQSLENTVFVGLQPRGVFVAGKIVEAMQELVPNQIQYGVLDITFYRDDVRLEIHRPSETNMPFGIDGKNVILIDDVLYTGRTIRAAMDALMDFGRPKTVKLCTLIDRFHSRQLPIQADYTGLLINSFEGQKVKVVTEEKRVVVYN